MVDILVLAEILWPAMVAGLFVIATHVPLGREVLNRGIIFLDLAIAQTAAFGVVFANTHWSHGHGHSDHPTSVTGVAIAAAILGSLALYSIRKLEVRTQESIIGIMFVLMATGVILLLSADPHGGEKLKEMLVGQILWLQVGDLLQLGLVYAVVLGLWYFLHERAGEWLFYPLFAITITLSTQVVGVYLVFASLIIPALATLKTSFSLAKAYALGVAGYALGLAISALADLPAGASIVWSLAVVGSIFFFASGGWQRMQAESQ